MSSKFGTKSHDGESSKGGNSPFINYGNHVLMINSFEVRKASTGSEQVRINFEGAPVEEAGFEAHEDSTNGGKIGRVNFSSWLANENQVEEFNTNMAILTNKLGVKEEVDAIEADDLQDYLDKITPLVKGKQAHWLICAEEYLDDKGDTPKTKYSLKTARYGFMASMAEGVDHIDAFDKENKYHYKKLEETPDEMATTTESGGNTWG